MKKWVLTIPILITLLTGCSLVEKEEPVYNVTPEETHEKLKNKEDFILVIGNERNCEPCVRYLKGGLRKLSDKESFKADYLTVDTISKQKDMDLLIKILSENFEQDVLKPLGTPTTFIVKEGELLERIEGPVLYEDLVVKYEAIKKEAD